MLSILPPDLLQIEEIITPSLLLKLKQHSATGPIRIQFVYPVEPLDVFFMLNWFLSYGVENINIDFYTADPILLKKASDGIFKLVDILDYCEPQNLVKEQKWLKEISPSLFQVDPRILLKIQFNWIESLKVLKSMINQGNYHFIVKGPVFSDSYEKLPFANSLPCYEVSLQLPI